MISAKKVPPIAAMAKNHCFSMFHYSHTLLSMSCYDTENTAFLLILNTIEGTF